MKAINHLFATITRAAFMFASISSVYTPLHAQPPANAITVYQYRHVPDSKIDEFIKRETTYWSKVAKKAVDNKKMTFWALLEKVGGYDLPNCCRWLELRVRQRHFKLDVGRRSSHSNADSHSDSDTDSNAESDANSVC